MMENLQDSTNLNNYIDFNSLVDDILEISPHYNYKLPKVSKNIKKLPKNNKTILLSRMNSNKTKFIEEKSIILTRNNSEMSKLLNMEGSKNMMPTDYQNFSYKDLNNWGRSCISPNSHVLEGYSRILRKNEEETIGLLRNEGIEEESKKKSIFGMSISQKFDDFWAGGS